MPDYSVMLKVDLPILNDKVECPITTTNLQEAGGQISPPSLTEITEPRLISPEIKHWAMRPFPLPRHATTDRLPTLFK
jgi:hypothetical protein